MNKSVAVRSKLTEPQKAKVVAMLAKGLTQKEIVEIVKKDFDVDISMTVIKKIKKNNGPTIAAMQEIFITAEVTDAVNIKKRALKQLDKKLERIEKQEDYTEQLYQDYLDGVITDTEYRKQKALQAKISARDLSAIAKELSAQVDPVQPGATALPAGQDPKWVDSLLQAVQRGDTIAMQQLIITPNVNDQQV